MDYSMETTLADTTIDEAVEKVTAALAEQGFGVLTTIDVQQTLKNKIDVDFRPYRILGACNPKLAHRALGADPQIGLLLPCNVVVEEEDQGARVRIIDPVAMFSVVDREDIAPLADEVKELLGKALAAVA
jgi:uncharacterized protein (DUF302 family)